jgi:DNA modification methylase
VSRGASIKLIRRGDVFALGRHRLMCGDATSAQDVLGLVSGRPVHMVLTDPPYGIQRYRPAEQKHYAQKRKNFSRIIGDESTATAIAALRVCLVLFPKATMIWWGANHYAEELPPSRGWIVWDKQRGATCFADAELAWTNAKSTVRVFRHQWNGFLRASERGEKRCHPTQKPTALSVWCINRFGKDSEVVLDLFGGAGSALLACEETGRVCLMMEIAPMFCRTIIERWERKTGLKARLVRRAIAEVAA